VRYTPETLTYLSLGNILHTNTASSTGHDISYLNTSFYGEISACLLADFVPFWNIPAAAAHARAPKMPPKSACQNR
jgi:hypothetical protein